MICMDWKDANTKCTIDTVKDFMADNPNLSPEKVPFRLAEKYPRLTYETSLTIVQREHVKRRDKASRRNDVKIKPVRL